jgi:hypothetical protein
MPVPRNLPARMRRLPWARVMLAVEILHACWNSLSAAERRRAERIIREAVAERRLSPADRGELQRMVRKCADAARKRATRL